MEMNCRSVTQPCLEVLTRGRVYGSCADPRTDILPGRGPVLAREEPAQGLERPDAGGVRRAPAGGLRFPAQVAAQDVRSGLHGPDLAQGLRWPRAHLHGGCDSPAADRAGPTATPR